MEGEKMKKQIIFGILSVILFSLVTLPVEASSLYEFGEPGYWDYDGNYAVPIPPPKVKYYKYSVAYQKGYLDGWADGYEKQDYGKRCKHYENKKEQEAYAAGYKKGYSYGKRGEIYHD